MIATLNVFGKGEWSTKITSLLSPGEWIDYDESNYDLATASLEWIIAEEDGEKRSKIASTYLSDVTYKTLFKGLDDLEGVTVGDGLVVGPGSLIRPSTVIGNQVYIGAGTITCNYDGVKKSKTKIKDNVFIGSNSSLVAPVTINKKSIVGAGSVITKNVKEKSLAITRPKQIEVKNYKRK